MTDCDLFGGNRGNHSGKLRAMGTAALLNWAVGARAIGRGDLLQDLFVSCHYRIGIDAEVHALYFFFATGAFDSYFRLGCL